MNHSLKNRSVWLGLLLLLWLFAVNLGQAQQSEPVSLPKSPSDPREYAGITLPNQLQVVLISDPSTDKAAASLNVRVGSGSDPADRSGLAHMLEHMLFLGTEKYPEPGEYKAFLSSHGGDHNAYTALLDTNYFFDVDKDYLEPALDRFAQFFIAPLFTAKYVNNERQVVHSEYQSKLRSDGWRIRSVQQQAYNPEHPAAKFSIGSQDTLADRAGRSIREELIDFYRQHYSANLMTLTVLGKEPLSQLEQWVREKFAAIPNSDRAVPGVDSPGVDSPGVDSPGVDSPGVDSPGVDSPGVDSPGVDSPGVDSPDVDQPLFKAGQLPLRLDVTPIKDEHRVSLLFPLPPVNPHYRTKPVQYLAYLLGYEGEGSVLSLLKQRGWANALWAGLGADNDSEAALVVSIDLTPAGLQAVEQVLGKVFEYIQLIQRAGISERLYDEQRRLAEISFRFQESSEPIRTVRALSSAMNDYPLTDLLRGPYLMADYKPELIAQFANELRPDNVLITVSSKNLPTDQVEPWFGTPYKRSRLAPDLIQTWLDADIDPALNMPAPNPFIPEHLTLKSPPPDSPAIPMLLDNPADLELWHQLDDTFKVPRAEFYFSVRSPVANDTAEHAVLTELYVRMVEEQLSELSYPAYVAGLEYKIYKHIRGFTVRLSGYDEKQPLLLQLILEALKTPQIDEARFARIQDELRRKLLSARENPPYRQTYGEVSNLLLTPQWSNDEQLEALAKISADNLRAFVPQLLGRLFITSLAYGNVSRSDAQALGRQLRAELLQDKQIVQVERGRLLKLAAGQDYLRKLDIEHQDSALTLYLQGPDKSIPSRVLFGLLAEWLESPFFEQLRTEQKLGYIVFASAMSIVDVPGLVFVVQSPSAKPALLQQHVDAFIAAQLERIDQLSDDEFKRLQASLMSRLLTKDQTLQDRAERYWVEIDRKNANFDTREQLAKALRELGPEDLRAAYQNWIAGPDRRRLSVHSAGQEDEAVEQDLPALAAPVLIDDPAAFKQQLESFSG